MIVERIAHARSNPARKRAPECNLRNVELTPGTAMHIADEVMLRVDKKTAGRLIDGRIWDEMPSIGDRDVSPAR